MGSGTGWAPRQDRRCPLPHPQVKLVGDELETPRARPTRREGSRLQAQHGGQEWRELSPPPSPLRLFSKPFPGLSPARTGCGLRMAGGGGRKPRGSSAPRTAVPASWCVGGGGGAWGAGTQGPYRAAGTSVEPGSCPPHGRQRLGHFSGHGAGAPGCRPPLSPTPPSSPPAGAARGWQPVCPALRPCPQPAPGWEWCAVTPPHVTACGGPRGGPAAHLPRSQALSTEMLSAPRQSTSTPPLQGEPAGVVPPPWGLRLGVQDPGAGHGQKTRAPGRALACALQTPRPTPAGQGVLSLPRVASSQPSSARTASGPSGARTEGSDGYQPGRRWGSGDSTEGP